jgi:hypothetical protein
MLRAKTDSEASELISLKRDRGKRSLVCTFFLQEYIFFNNYSLLHSLIRYFSSPLLALGMATDTRETTCRETLLAVREPEATPAGP